MIISRRGFLKGVGAGIAAAAVPKIALAAGELYTPPNPEIVLPETLVISREPGAYVTQNAQEGIMYPRPDWNFKCDRKFHFDAKRKIITYVGETGFRLQDMYNTAKNQWRYISGLSSFEFPFVAVTPEFFYIEAGWQVNPSSFDWMRSGTLFDEQAGIKWATVRGLSSAEEAPCAYLYRLSVKSKYETKVIGEQMIVNPWYHTIQITPDIEGLRWCGITPGTLFWEFNTLDAGIPLGSIFDNNGTLFYPFSVITDLSYGV